jgi:hypothetical protein
MRQQDADAGYVNYVVYHKKDPCHIEIDDASFNPLPQIVSDGVGGLQAV